MSLFDEPPVEETPQDTEITLGTGKMLFLFFGLVALCAVFFGMGYTVGKNSATSIASEPPAANTTTAVRPSGTKPSTTPGQQQPDLTFYKNVEQKDANAQLTPPEATNNPTKEPAQPAAEPPAPAKDPMAVPINNSTAYFVQVAAVTKQEDADALVDALKKKEYAAFSANGAADKLIHVQIGPFTDIKEAEATRTKLVGDGYNPILKK